MGRPKEFKVDEALLRAMELFREQGYESTTFENLIQSTGIQKASLYATFGDKKALFMHALLLYHEESRSWVRELLAGPGPMAAKIRDFLLVPATLDSDGKLACCLWVNTQIELSSRDAEIAQVQRDLMESMLAIFADALSQGVRQSEFRVDLDVQAASRSLFTLASGLYVVTRCGIQEGEWAPMIDAFIQSLR